MALTREILQQYFTEYNNCRGYSKSIFNIKNIFYVGISLLILGFLLIIVTWAREWNHLFYYLSVLIMVIGAILVYTGYKITTLKKNCDDIIQKYPELVYAQQYLDLEAENQLVNPRIEMQNGQIVGVVTSPPISVLVPTPNPNDFNTNGCTTTVSSSTKC